MKQSNRPEKVSILLSTYNWKEALELVLLSLFQQSALPDEIVIADDGSRDDTRETIERLRKQTSIPIIHVWQEDDGFRKTEILNKAIVAITSEYIIEVDGDCVPHKHFVKDHLDFARQGYYVCGSRMYCTKKFSERWMKTKRFNPLLFRPIHGSFFNGFRIGWMRRHVTRNFSVTIKGCNMAFWRDDIIAINGFDEDYKGWGYEDHDLAYRLDNLGVKRQTLKMGALMYHLYHKETKHPGNAELENRLKKLEQLRVSKVTRAEKGIDKYL